MGNLTSEKIRRKLVWQTICAVLIVVVLITLLAIQYTQFWALSIKEKQLQSQLDTLQKERTIFEQEYNYKSSDEFIEDYAHEVLGWGRAGESYYKS